MKNILHRLVGIAITLCFLNILVFAQNIAFTEGKADKNLKSSVRVNPITRAMEMTIPLAGFPGRAGNSTPASIRYTSKTWRMESSGIIRRFNPTINQHEPIATIAPRFAERSSGGWSSSLTAPRIQFVEERFDLAGNGSSPDANTPPIGENCVGHTPGQPTGTCFLESSVTACHRTGIILDGTETWECTTTATYRCIYFNTTYFMICTGNPNPSPPIIDNWFVKRVRVFMPGGSSHEFRKDDYLHYFDGVFDNVGTFLSVDGSGMRLELGAAGQNHTLYMSDGGRYLFNANETLPDADKFASEYIDANGNKTQFVRTVEQTRINGKVIDNLGREINDPLQQNQYPLLAAGTQPINWVGLNGSPINQSLVWKQLDQAFDTSERSLKYLGSCENNQGLPTNPDNQTLFPTPQTQRFNTSICQLSGSGIFNPVVLAEVLNENGSKYEFKYNEYGEITEIRHPTGAVEKFEYEIVPQIGTNTTLAYAQANRGVKKHWVYETAQSTPRLWEYNYEDVIAPDGSKVKRTPFVSFDTLYGFDDPRAGMVKEEKAYDTTGQLRSRTLNEWIVTPAQGTNAFQGASRDARPSRKISISYEDGKILASMSETDYETPGENGSTAPTDLSYFAHLNVKQTRSYHYLTLTSAEANESYDAAISNLKNKFYQSGQLASTSQTDYSYDPNYKARGILGLVSETRVLNPTNTSDVLAKSQFVYDEAAYFDNNYTTTGWVDPGSTLRGNVTTARTWNKDTNTWIESHTMFDNFGNVRKIWDTSGDPTRFIESEYDPVYKYAYSTKTKAPAPDPTGVHGTTEGSEISRVYDFNTGLLTSVTDANGQTATTEYDALLRPIRINPPAGGSVSETIYNDTPGNIWVKSRQQIDANNWAESTTYFDNLGRAFKSRTKDLQGDVMSQVKFDSFGRVEKTSNPYRVDANGNPAETVYWSKPRYDEANRVVETFAPAPDGQTGMSLGTVQFGISTLANLIGAYVVSTDASGRKSRAISGIYGLMRIDEATGKGGTIDQDLGTLANPNQPTYYGYNIKGEMTRITQGSQNRYFMYDSFGRLIRVRQPEQTPNANLATSGNPDNNQWTAGYTYDVFGNVVSVTDAKDITITNFYDKVSRTTKRTYSDGTPQVEYFYDGKGLPSAPQFSKGSLTKVTSSVSEDRFTGFDNHGRLLTSEQITDGQVYPFTYKYNLSGGLTEQTYPSGRIVRNFLDNDGGLSSVTTKAHNGLNKIAASDFDYSATGNVRKMKLGNGLWETTEVSQLGQLTQVGLGTTATNKNLFKVDYEYGELNTDGTTVDANKNIGMIAKTTTTIPTTSFVQTFKYDSINRLTEAVEKTGTTQNWKQTFGYDRFGNRTSFYQIVGSTELPTNNITKPTIDQANNRFTTGQGYVYDLNGNLIEDAQGRSFTFNGDDKQTVVRDVSNNIVGQYFYDGSGARIKKYVPSTGETTVFVYDAGGALAAEYSTVSPPQNPTTSYLTTDHLGSPRVITDDNGEVIARRDFMPFGEELGVGVGGRTENLKYSYLGSDRVRQRFTGYEKDDETGLDFAEARMYQNKHGRFTAPDPLLASAEPANPQSFNRYVYTANNPVNYTDPSGLSWCRSNSGKTTFTGEGAACPEDTEDDKWTNIDGDDVLLGAGDWSDVSGQTGDYGTLNADGSFTRLASAAEVAESAVQVHAEQQEILSSDAAAISGAITNQPLVNSPFGGSVLCPTGTCIPDIDMSAGSPILDLASAVLTICGFLLDPCDVGSGVVDAMNGDPVGAAMSVPSAIPGPGIAVGATKLIHKLKRLTDAADGAKKSKKGWQDTPENIERMKEGKPPIGNDGHPVELHHKGQQPNSELVPKTRTEHRGKGNYKKNHPNKGPSMIDRKKHAKQRREYWKNKAKK